ncbi:uncharacterized protein [Haliaeetus albicilla]|uniref:uncharacterized protein n=1 Tax=Haliaeetus albicilla TaxID=8969 RepID=UPI0037E81D91
MRSQRECEVTEPRGDAPDISTNRSAPGPHCGGGGSSSSSSSSSRVQVPGAMAPARHLLVLLILLVALHVRAARAALWQARGAAVLAGEGDAASRLGSRTEGPGDGMVTDGPVGRTLPAPRLDAVLQPGLHRRGPPRAKYLADGGKKSLQPSEYVRQMLEELERGHETDREAVQKVISGESSGSLPVSAEELEARQAPGTPGSCCPVAGWCHPSGWLRVSRLFPQRSLLHVTPAAKAGSVLGSRPLGHVLQMMGDVPLNGTCVPP